VNTGYDLGGGGWSSWTFDFEVVALSF